MTIDTALRVDGSGGPDRGPRPEAAAIRAARVTAQGVAPPRPGSPPGWRKRSPPAATCTQPGESRAAAVARVAARDGAA